jgi:hypothetical protein
MLIISSIKNPNSIMLKECKRLQTQEDKDKLNNINFDFFENILTLKMDGRT